MTPEPEPRRLQAGAGSEAACSPQRLDADAVAELAERLAGQTLRLEPLEDGDQLGDDAVEGDVVLELDVEAVADGAAAQEDRVGARAGRAVGVPMCADRPTRPMSAL